MSSKSKEVHDDELRTYARDASKGDAVALDHFFAEVAASAWGLSFAKTDTITGAGRRLTEGISLALHSLASRSKTEHSALIVTLRHVAHASTSQDAPLAATPEATNRSQVTTTPASHTPTSPTDAPSTQSIGSEPANLLGEAQDREALLAFVALNEFSRCVLWLHVAEDLAADDVAYILDSKSERVKDTASTASTQFRQHYLEAIPREGLPLACLHNLDRLGAYITGALDSDGVAETELHLVNCANCRGIVMRITNVGTRVRAGIPPMPSWARHEVASRWTDTRGAALPFVAPPSVRHSRFTPRNLAAGTVAAAALLALVSLTLTTFRDRETRLANESTSTTLVTSTSDATATSETTSPLASATTEPTTTSTAHDSATTTASDTAFSHDDQGKTGSSGPAAPISPTDPTKPTTPTRAPSPQPSEANRTNAKPQSASPTAASGRSAKEKSTPAPTTLPTMPTTPATRYIIIETTTVTETITVTETTRITRTVTRQPAERVIAGGVVSATSS